MQWNFFLFEEEHAPLISLSNGVFAFYPYDLEIDFQSDGTGLKQRILSTTWYGDLSL